MPASTPVVTDQPTVTILLDSVGGSADALDVSGTCEFLEFRGMMNGGYVVRFRIIDANFNLINDYLVLGGARGQGYFSTARSTIFRVRFKIGWVGGNNATQLQTAYVVSCHPHGDNSDSGIIEFVAIDPPSWFLNCGDAAGSVYSGKISDVITAVVNDYAPDIDLTVTDTTDSEHSMYWMMRQDPKSFILSLLDWSAALTPRKTQWIVSMDNANLLIKEQAAIESRNVGFYHGPPRVAGGAATINDWEVLADNALSLMNTKLVTGGISAISGQYLDRRTDETEVELFVKDATTANKYKARTTGSRAFTKPPDAGPPRVGWTSIPGVPELYSAGDIGKAYSDYIDGRPRALYLNMANLIQRVRFRVLGHGIYYNTVGLGTDTITVEWTDASMNPFFLAGNWILYGFWHRFWAGAWETHLYCARLDWDATATAVPAAGAGP